MIKEMFVPQSVVSEMMKSYNTNSLSKEISESLYDPTRDKHSIHLVTQLSNRIQDYQERINFLTSIGFKFWQDKFAFAISNVDYKKPPSYKLEFSSISESDINNLQSMMIKVLLKSEDRCDLYEVTTKGALETALDRINGIGDGILADISWWKIGKLNGVPVGYVLPAKFEGCEKNSLIEGTIYHVGVLPEYRGHGFGKELFLRGCQQLNEIGMWRIFNDTDSLNLPMINTFKKAGHKEVDKVSKFHITLQEENKDRHPWLKAAP